MKRKYINDSLKALYKRVLLNNTIQNSFLANILSFYPYLLITLDFYSLFKMK